MERQPQKCLVNVLHNCTQFSNYGDRVCNAFSDYDKNLYPVQNQSHKKLNTIHTPITKRKTTSTILHVFLLPFSHVHTFG